jgi:osmotically inducible protein OsmC
MKLMIRKASFCWQGSSQASAAAHGVMTQTKSAQAILHSPDFGLDPAELMAVTHARSFSLALSRELGLHIFTPGEILTTATLTLKRRVAGWTILNLHLQVVARLPRTTQRKFIDAALRAKTKCLVSRLLRAHVSMNTRLVKFTARIRRRPAKSKALSSK